MSLKISDVGRERGTQFCNPLINGCRLGASTQVRWREKISEDGGSDATDVLQKSSNTLKSPICVREMEIQTRGK